MKILIILSILGFLISVGMFISNVIDNIYFKWIPKLKSFQRKHIFRKKRIFDDEDLISRWKEFADELLERFNIDTSSLIIQNEYERGAVGPLKSWIEKPENSKMKSSKLEWEGTDKIFDINRDSEYYIIVPEIINWWTFRSWVHEIGHVVNGHWKEEFWGEELDYIKEYEAEEFCIKYCKEFYDNNHILYSGTCLMDFTIESAQKYLKTFIDKAIDNNIQVPNHIKSFCNITKDDLMKQLDEKIIK